GGRRSFARHEADAHPRLVPAALLRSGRRLDQLQVELAAGALEQRASRQNAEVLALRQHRKAEQASIEIQPIGGAVDEDGLHHAEVVQAGERWRPGIGARERHEIDVVNGEIAVTVYEVDKAVAHAVDSRDVQLHGGRPRRNVPGAELERAPCAKAASRTRSAIAASAGVLPGEDSPGSASGCALTIRFIEPWRYS